MNKKKMANNPLKMNNNNNENMSTVHRKKINISKDNFA